eukprot:298025_1
MEYSMTSESDDSEPNASWAGDLELEDNCRGETEPINSGREDSTIGDTWTEALVTPFPHSEYAPSCTIPLAVLSSPWRTAAPERGLDPDIWSRSFTVSNGSVKSSATQAATPPSTHASAT